MNLSSHTKKTARTLFRANRKLGISWRTIQHNGYIEEDVIVKPGVNATTLCRFAKSKAKWIPASIDLQKALGIYHERQRPAKMISDMSCAELLYCLQHRAPITNPSMNKTQLNDYVKACRAASKQRRMAS